MTSLFRNDHARPAPGCQSGPATPLTLGQEIRHTLSGLLNLPMGPDSAHRLPWPTSGIVSPLVVRAAVLRIFARYDAPTTVAVRVDHDKARGHYEVSLFNAKTGEPLTDLVEVERLLCGGD